MPEYSRGFAVGFVVFLGVGLSACDRSRLPTTSPPPPPPSQAGLTLSGVVFDHTSNGPVPRANIPLRVRVYPSSWHAPPGFVSMAVTSDGLGRYALSGVPAGSISIAPASGSGYYAPCPSGWGVVQSDRVFDVHVVSATLLSSAGMPADIPLGGISVSGVVFEETPQGRRPVSGANVNLSDEVADPQAGSITLTDAAGRYLMCPPVPSRGSDTHWWVRINLEGFRPASRVFLLGWEYAGIDVELSRN